MDDTPSSPRSFMFKASFVKGVTKIDVKAEQREYPYVLSANMLESIHENWTKWRKDCSSYLRYIPESMEICA